MTLETGTVETIAEPQPELAVGAPVEDDIIDEVGDVDCEEIARGDEAIDGFEADVIGVDEVGVLPAERFYCVIGFGADACGLAVDDEMFAVGFIPDGSDLYAELLGFDECGELGFALVSEAVADSHAIF